MNPTKKENKINQKDKSFLGKKFLKEEKKIEKKMENFTFDDKDNQSLSESEYETVSDDEEVYESDDNSENYEQKNIEDFGKKKKKENVVSIWNEKNQKIEKDEELVFDNSAYKMLHRSNVSWPCFSVDWVIPEFFYPQPMKNFYSKMKPTLYPDEFPYTCYFIAGAQSSEKNGLLYYMKWFNMQRTLYDEDPDREADSESEGGEPLMEHSSIQTKGNVNRVKTMKNSYMAAYWSDQGSVELVDLRKNINEMESRWSDDKEDKTKSKKVKKNEEINPHVKSFKKKDEGFALDWNNMLPGVFASGGYDNEVEVHIPTDELVSDYKTNKTNEGNMYGYLTNIKANKGGVEDISWSPVSPHLLISVGIDGCIKLWDIRQNLDNNKNNGSLSVSKAHSKDINCVSWKESLGTEMIATGGDDCVIKVWDPRFMKDNNSTIAMIQYHTEPISSLSWDPISPCQLAVTSEDNRLSIWDFSVEPDSNKLKDEITNKEIPDQLVFLHQGQENLKDVKFHPYYEEMLLSTAESGLNIFKPNFDEEDSEDED
jgi:ribosome assembly protein RRB1